MASLRRDTPERKDPGTAALNDGSPPVKDGGSCFWGYFEVEHDLRSGRAPFSPPSPPADRPSRPRRRAVPTPSPPVWSVGRPCRGSPAFAGCRLACGPARIFAGPVRPTYQCTDNLSRSRSARWPRAPLLGAPIAPPRTADPIPPRRRRPPYPCTDNPSTHRPGASLSSKVRASACPDACEPAVDRCLDLRSVGDLFTISSTDPLDLVADELERSEAFTRRGKSPVRANGASPKPIALRRSAPARDLQNDASRLPLRRTRPRSRRSEIHPPSPAGRACHTSGSSGSNRTMPRRRPREQRCGLPEVPPSNSNAVHSATRRSRHAFQPDPPFRSPSSHGVSRSSLRSGVRKPRHHQRTELRTLVRHASALGPGGGEQGGLRLAQECRYRRDPGRGVRHLRFSDL